jgi:hypothetical protein
MKYVLVTTWPKHWDKIESKSSFTYSMLRGSVMNPDNIVERTPALFIRDERGTGLPQKCWKGEILTKKRTEEEIWFTFKLDGLVECPEGCICSPDGWFVED